MRTRIPPVGRHPQTSGNLHGSPDVFVGRRQRSAGGSQRTVFRYVDSKEELAFIHPILWFDVFEAALQTAPAKPLLERLHIASRAIATYIDADPEPLRRALTVVAAHPQLARGFMAVYQTWIERIATEVLHANPDHNDPGDHFRSRIIGSAVMGMVDSVTRQWILSLPHVTFVDLYEQGFARLAPLLEEGPSHTD